jgi:hypothetical protein
MRFIGAGAEPAQPVLRCGSWRGLCRASTIESNGPRPYRTGVSEIPARPRMIETGGVLLDAEPAATAR